MHRFLKLHKLQCKIILSFDSYHNKMQSNQQSMENLMVIRVEVIAPENPLDSDYNICKRLK